ncbi:MAG TPA: DUF4136 domain-containing protein [Chthoniobacterales bacterium]|jgi:hypothetical protein|nr:DUF4136 domain-containing protein [Chthoniobacterales bacterium]
MKTVHSLCFAAAVICLFPACETVTVSTDYDRAANFGKYRTYALTPPSRGQTMSSTSEAALSDALRAELNSRGLTEAPARNADLDIVRQVFAQQKTSVQEWTNWGYGHHGGWPYGYGYYGMWAGAPVSYVDVWQYQEGTLILDFVDARTKKLVFRGVGKAVIGGPESNAGKIREAVNKIVAGYPGAAAH